GLGLTDSTPRTTEPLPHLTNAFGPPDHPDAPCPLAEEVIGCQPPPTLVVDRDGGQLLRACLSVDDHHRDAIALQPTQSREHMANRGNQNAGHSLLLKEVEVGGLPVPLLGGIAQQQRPTEFSEVLLG